MERRFKSHTPSRDAIVWDYDDANMTVRCKIQGSDEYVVCHYPRNFRTKEEWCKRGNAVRIEHKGGSKGYLEVVGHGRAIPSPVSGSSFPTPETPYDGVISGGVITPAGGLSVDISSTVYRIDNLLYQVTTQKTLDAAPSVGQFRYDVLVAGKDGAVDIVKGTAAATAPAMPAVPADHVRIGHVFVIGGVTEILESHVNVRWEARRMVSLTLAFASGSGTIQNGNEFVWHLSNNTPTCSMTITFLDQYGWEFSGTRTTTLSLLSGSGDISGDNSNWGTSDVDKESTGTTVAFYYRRDQTASEASPMFSFSVAGESGFATGHIKLLDVNGDEVL